jgi:ankyrin repeat protein
LHYACYFGKIKALKALVEIFGADMNAIDYRGQTPLHVASTSGELGSIVYMCSRGEACEKEASDNALMTPIMNSVAFNH